MCDDEPAHVEELSRSDEGFRKLCLDLSYIEGNLRLAERSQRALFAAPVDLKFLSAWRDYEKRFGAVLVGLDRIAVSEAFSDFVAAGTATAAQIEFINLVIEHLTDQGVMDPGLLYEPPFTDIASTGPEKLFDDNKVTQLFARISADHEVNFLPPEANN
jgi:hypothetical protein